jgi:hypothetical protein
VGVEELEEEGGRVLIKGAGELVDDGRDLQSLHQNSALTLDANISGPLDEAGQVTLGEDITANAKVLGALLEQGVLLASGGDGNTTLLDGGGGSSGGGDLLSLRCGGFGTRLKKNDKKGSGFCSRTTTLQRHPKIHSSNSSFEYESLLPRTSNVGQRGIRNTKS